MSAQSVGRIAAWPADRGLLRAVALGTAVLVGIAGPPVAHAASSTAPVAAFAAHDSDDSAADSAAIGRLKASYFANVDAKDWTALRTLFATDAVVDTRASLGPIFYNRDSFIAFTRSVLGPLSTRHQGYDPQITFASPTEASVEWTMQDHLIFRDTVGVHGYGRYSDRYEKIGDTWVIEYSRLTRTGITVVFPGLDHFVSEFGRRLSMRGPIAALAYTVSALAHIGAPYTNPTPPVVPGDPAAAVRSIRVANAQVASASAPTRSFALAATAVTGTATASPDVKAPQPSGPQTGMGTSTGTQTDRAEAVGPSSRGADAALDAKVHGARAASTHGTSPSSITADADAPTARATASAAEATPKTADEPEAEG